jgi:hypothetical protein
LLDSDEVKSVVETIAAELAEKKLDGAPWSIDTIEAFSRPDPVLATRLHGARADYIFELILPQLLAATPIGFDPNLLCFACLRLTDASSGNRILTAKAMPMRKLRLGEGDIKRAVEGNNLSLLRDFVDRTIDSMPRFNVVGLGESIVQISDV